jgi:WXXGXW repeat (2 copies)
MVRVTKWICLLALILGVVAMPSALQAQISVGIGIHIGPPALPIYAQPICPGVGYMWTPGYWAYGPDGYFWVPGTWVMAPSVGVLWTPGYWGWGGGGYFWHGGYWGPHVGFYGGISYGFGYTGVGFAGGEWRGGAYHYNTAVTNVNSTVIHNTYNTTVVNSTTVNRTSFNGGAGGVAAQPTAAEAAAAREPHTPATALQTQHQQAASSNRALLASVNHGAPTVAATAKPGTFTGPGVVAAHSAAAVANESRPAANGEKGAAMQADRPPSARTNAATSTSGAAPANSNTKANKPNTSQTNATKTNNTQANTSHPNNTHPNESKAKTSHPHNDKPPKQTHPPEAHSGARGR